MSILIVVMAGLLPLLIAPGLVFHYDITPRVAALALIAVIALARPAAAGELAALGNRRSGRWLCAVAMGILANSRRDPALLPCTDANHQIVDGAEELDLTE